MKVKCYRCTHEWIPRKDTPTRCPNRKCKSLYWNKQCKFNKKEISNEPLYKAITKTYSISEVAEINYWYNVGKIDIYKRIKEHALIGLGKKYVALNYIDSIRLCDEAVELLIKLNKKHYNLINKKAVEINSQINNDKNLYKVMQSYGKLKSDDINNPYFSDREFLKAIKRELDK